MSALAEAENIKSEYAEAADFSENKKLDLTKPLFFSPEAALYWLRHEMVCLWFVHSFLTVTLKLSMVYLSLNLQGVQEKSTRQIVIDNFQQWTARIIEKFKMI